MHMCYVQNTTIISDKKNYVSPHIYVFVATVSLFAAAGVINFLSCCSPIDRLYVFISRFSSSSYVTFCVRFRWVDRVALHRVCELQFAIYHLISSMRMCKYLFTIIYIAINLIVSLLLPKKKKRANKNDTAINIRKYLFYEKKYAI